MSLHGVTTFNQVDKWQVCKDRKDGLGTGVEVSENKNNLLATAPDGLQKGAGGQSSTVLCFP